MPGAVDDFVAALSNTSVSTAGTSDPVTSNPTNSSLYGIPAYQMLNPNMGTSSAWQLTNPSAQLYVGSTTQTGKPYSDNAILAALADKLGITQANGVSLQEQVLDVLSERYNTKATWQALRQKLQPTLYEAIGPQGSPPPAHSNLQLVAARLGVQVTGQQGGPDQTASVSSVASQFLNMTRDQIEQLQQQLYNAGFYDDAIYSDPSVNYTPGQLDLYTTMAIGNLLNASAAVYKQGIKATWQQVLNNFDTENTQQISVISAAKSKAVTLATPAQLQAPLQKGYEEELGYLPSTADEAQFTSEYDAAQAAHASDATAQGTGIDFGTGSIPGSGVPVVPGVPSVSAAVVPFAQSQNPIGYVGHNVENAYALLLNALGMGKTATSTLPGYNPNTT